MRIKTTIISICMVLLISMSAVAKQPAADGCNILVVLPNQGTGVVANKPFEIKVIQSPSYPGQWFSPTISVEVIVPIDNAIMLGPNTYSQTVIQSVDGPGGSNIATATFVIPPLTNLDVNGDIYVFATVSETVNKGKSIATYCEAVTGF